MQNAGVVRIPFPFAAPEAARGMTLDHDTGRIGPLWTGGHCPPNLRADHEPIFSELPTTIFEVMSRLAREHQAVNLGQGFRTTGTGGWSAARRPRR